MVSFWSLVIAFDHSHTSSRITWKQLQNCHNTSHTTNHTQLLKSHTTYKLYLQNLYIMCKHISFFFKTKIIKDRPLSAFSLFYFRRSPSCTFLTIYIYLFSPLLEVPPPSSLPMMLLIVLPNHILYKSWKRIVTYRKQEKSKIKKRNVKWRSEQRNAKVLKQKGGNQNNLRPSFHEMV